MAHDILCCTRANVRLCAAGLERARAPSRGPRLKPRRGFLNVCFLAGRTATCDVCALPVNVASHLLVADLPLFTVHCRDTPFDSALHT